MSQATWTMQLSSELATRTESLRREGQSQRDVMEQIYKLGLYQLEYRRETNPKKAEQQKAMRALYKKAQADPELAVRLGLGTRPEL